MLGWVQPSQLSLWASACVPAAVRCPRDMGAKPGAAAYGVKSLPIRLKPQSALLLSPESTGRGALGLKFWGAHRASLPSQLTWIPLTEGQCLCAQLSDT